MDPCLHLGSAANFVSGQRILSRVIVSLPSLTKRYKRMYAASRRQGIASSGFVSTLRTTILSLTLTFTRTRNEVAFLFVLRTLFRALRKPTTII
jgi:hypothetical protein